MIKKFDILIDASGSMGYMKGTKHEDKYLLPDKSTRTDLVKKILIKSIIPKLSFAGTINLSSFRNETKKDSNGKLIVIDNRYQEFPHSKNFYQGYYDSEMINKIISRIDNPEIGGTPLFWAISEKLNISDNIVVLSDGDANDVENFDEEILKKIIEKEKKCKIYFIGISQDQEAARKSKNLADKTGGFYVNLDVINYDESVFENMLFEFNTTITSNALKENLGITSSPIKDPQVTSEQLKNESIESNEIKNNEKRKEEDVYAIEDTPIDLKAQVTENTKSLKLISTQLDSIVKQISFIKSNPEEDEFTANEDEELNKIIGNTSEKYLFEFLKSKWVKTKWLNENGEQGKPYDFEVESDGINYYIECKGTSSSSNEFFLTLNEWLFYLANRKNYRLYFVSEINSKNPSIHRIEDLLNDMAEGKLIPCSSINRKVKADRILFQIIN